MLFQLNIFFAIVLQRKTLLLRNCYKTGGWLITGFKEEIKLEGILDMIIKMKKQLQGYFSKNFFPSKNDYKQKCK